MGSADLRIFHMVIFLQFLYPFRINKMFSHINNFDHWVSEKVHNLNLGKTELVLMVFGVLF